MKRALLISALALFLIVLGFVKPVDGLPSTTIPLTLAPDEKGGEYLPALESDAIDVEMTSNIAVDVYILNNEQVQAAILNEDFDYEKKWESRTSLDVDYTVEDQDKIYYIMVHNTHDSETANVELEYKIYEEIGEEIVEDAVDDACCGGTVIAGIVGLTILVALGIFAKKRK